MVDSAVNGGSANLRNQTLHQLVGYAELIKASGVSRSTIERAWRGPWDEGEPRLPKPGKIGSRSIWAAEDANAWLLARARWQSGVLTSYAASNPDDLAPEQLGDSAFDFAQRAFAKQLGQPVSLEQISIACELPMSDKEAAARRASKIAAFENQYAHVGPERAVLLVAWLFPVLRPIMLTRVHGSLRRVFDDPEMLRCMGHYLLHDDLWEILIEDLTDKGIQSLLTPPVED